MKLDSAFELLRGAVPSKLETQTNSTNTEPIKQSSALTYRIGIDGRRETVMDRIPRAKDAPTEPFRPRKLLMAGRRPPACRNALRIGLMTDNRNSLTAASQSVWPVEPAPITGQDVQLMRILAYKSVHVKLWIHSSWRILPEFPESLR
jgi:hypothetical protein